MKHDRLEALLCGALRSAETPDAELVQKLKYRLLKEEPILKKNIRHPFRAAAVAAVAVALITATAFAAWHFLKPSEVAEQFDDAILSAAFESDTAVNINASATSGGYSFILLAVVTGKDITDRPYYSDGVQDGRTYAVIAIQNADGTPMPDTRDDAYGQVSFFATPLVKGLRPWQVNAMTMNGGYSETVSDGVTYRLVECDDVAVFADCGLYFAVGTGAFISRDTFNYDEQTGEIAVNPDYAGASAVFDLPLDKSLADPEAARAYLDGLELYSEADPAPAGEAPEIDGGAQLTASE